MNRHTADSAAAGTALSSSSSSFSSQPQYSSSQYSLITPNFHSAEPSSAESIHYPDPNPNDFSTRGSLFDSASNLVQNSQSISIHQYDQLIRNQSALQSQVSSLIRVQNEVLIFLQTLSNSHQSTIKSLTSFCRGHAEQKPNDCVPTCQYSSEAHGRDTPMSHSMNPPNSFLPHHPLSRQNMHSVHSIYSKEDSFENPCNINSTSINATSINYTSNNSTCNNYTSNNSTSNTKNNNGISPAPISDHARNNSISHQTAPIISSTSDFTANQNQFEILSAHAPTQLSTSSSSLNLFLPQSFFAAPLTPQSSYVDLIGENVAQLPPPSQFTKSPSDYDTISSLDHKRFVKMPPLLWIRSPKVLLVDDDLVCRKFSAKWLQLFGCSLEVMADGAFTASMMRSKKFDLDILMPKMDGVTATHQIRHFDQHTPIVAMTSNTSEVECRNYLEVGMNDVLAKPFSHVSLLDMLERYCSHLLPNHSTVSSPDSSSVENACIDSIQTVFEECDELLCRNSGKSNHLEYDEYTKCDHLPS